MGGEGANEEGAGGKRTLSFTGRAGNLFFNFKTDFLPVTGGRGLLWRSATMRVSCSLASKGSASCWLKL